VGDRVLLCILVLVSYSLGKVRLHYSWIKPCALFPSGNFVIGFHDLPRWEMSS